MTLHSVSPGIYPVRQLLMLIIFFNFCAANNKRMETVHNRTEFLSYSTAEIGAITEIKSRGIQNSVKQ